MTHNNVANRAVFDRYLTVSEERRLMAHMRQFSTWLARRDCAWITLARQTGLRIGSIGGLTVDDAEQALETNVLVVRPAIAKRKLGYPVPINRKAKQALTELLKLRRELIIRRSADDVVITSECLVLTLRNGKMSERSFEARLSLWAKDAGLKVAVSPHWLRHTCAKRVIASTEHRDPLGVVQAVLGQRKRSSAAIYSLPDRDDVRRALEAAA